MNSKQSGIALIQILLISALITVFVLFMTMTARQHVDYALLADQQMTALVNVQDASALVHYSLLTKRPVQREYNNLADRAGEWYFGQPIELDSGVVINIQDLSGLLFPLTSPVEDVQRVMTGLGYSANKTGQMTDRLLDWQDVDTLARGYGAEDRAYSIGPRNQVIPFVEEILWIEGIGYNDIAALDRGFTFIPIAGFNPLVAPEEVLRALYPQQTDGLLQLRMTQQLTIKQFQALTNATISERVRFFPSNRYRIQLSAVTDDVTLTQESVVEISSYLKTGLPLKQFYKRWNRPVQVNY